MAKRAKRNNDDGELHLPECIIHHIQSSLDAKKAAQTAVVSKSWYSAWLTRPNVDLNEYHFLKRRGADPALLTKEFWDFARNTIRWYEEQNLKIETFGLQVHSISLYSVSFSEELITKAAKMGVKEMDVASIYSQFDLPQQVLEAETLVRLSVRGLMIERPPGGLVKHSRLKSLTLERLRIESDCYTLIFPCLEDLTLRFCDVSEPIKIVSSLLKFINLETVRELVPGILNFESFRELRAKFEVPSICKFKFSGACYSSKLPMVTISTASREWESDISLDVDSYLGKTWPQQLRRFMKKISRSKVSVCFNFDASVCCAYDEEFKGKQGPLVENLMLSMPLLPSNIPRFFGGLFWSCPPKFITLFWFPGLNLPPKEKASNELIRFLCKEVIQIRESGPTKRVLFRNLGLGKVIVECFDDKRRKWHPISWRDFLIESMSPRTKKKVRFQLEWSAPLLHGARLEGEVTSTRSRGLQSNLIHDVPVPANHGRTQEIQQHRENNEVFSQRQSQIDRYSRMIKRRKARMHLFFSRANHHTKFVPLDGPNDPTSRNDKPLDSDVLDYLPPSDYPRIQGVLREVVSLLTEVQREYAGLLEAAGGKHEQIDHLEHLLNQLQERMELFFSEVTERLGIPFPPLDHPDDPTSENYRAPGDT